jgi:hypothetical protein
MASCDLPGGGFAAPPPVFRAAAVPAALFDGVFLGLEVDMENSLCGE